jgi:GR25 family glycosyltransferase involved in LPS biosynthesis
MRVPALLINLAERVDRRDFALAEARRVGVEIEFVSAVRAEDVPIDYVRMSGMTAGRIACWASHRKAWQAAQQRGASYALILEDDVRWLESPLSILGEASVLPQSAFDVLQLGSLHTGSRVATRRADYVYRAALVARMAGRIAAPAQRLEAWLAERSQLMSQAMNDVQSRALISREIEWGTFGSGAHAYLIGKSCIGRLLRFNWPPFLTTDDALSALAAQRNFRIGALAYAVATQAPLPSDLR